MLYSSIAVLRHSFTFEVAWNCCYKANSILKRQNSLLGLHSEFDHLCIKKFWYTSLCMQSQHPWEIYRKRRVFYTARDTWWQQALQSRDIVSHCAIHYEHLWLSRNILPCFSKFPESDMEIDMIANPAYKKVCCRCVLSYFVSFNWKVLATNTHSLRI